LFILKQLMASLLVNMPFSDTAIPVHPLLIQLEDLESSDTESTHSQEALSQCLRTQ
jgi:hypothetical protein